MATDSLTITDNRTGKTYEIPILYGTFPTYGAAIRSADLRQIKAADDDFGLMGYDPAFMNTASCKSAITHIDGERGILRYRGYPIEQLAEQSNYLEVAYLLIHGELPTKAQYDEWVHNITHHTMVHENLKKFTDGFHYDAHPMGMLVSTLAALSTFYPASKKVTEADNRKLEIYRLIGKAITLGAMTYRHTKGLPYVSPDNDLSYTGNYMNMLWKMAEPRYRPNPILEKALDVLFILHADHEQNCSTNAMRSVGSSQSDPYCAAAGGTAALYGPLHGGANEQVLRMLRTIGSKDKIPQFIQDVKDRKALLMGFGHRVYKNYDPRARIIKRLAEQVFEVTGKNPLLDMALELERIALEDEFFVKRKLYPNVDFYSGIIYEAMGFPTDYFTVLFMIPRMSGWLAQWQEMITDAEQKIARPRQVYTGVAIRDFEPIEKRNKK
ncbi:MAG: citrate synthase [candidate division NC10 bacterium]|nr:citrate synthase [candidate division NC10 bacterium]MBI2116463.1 citrate synthase [candidate division NC10 bacterium]MBI2163700.1 citrate synthase [candidate division NC10 bacterium]MBI2458393.1 citrate synthase [candidate division NC10 bacterium]